MIKSIAFYLVAGVFAVITAMQYLNLENKYGQLLPALTPATKSSSQAEFKKSFITQNQAVASVHASAIVELPNKQLMTVWYGGTREGSKDVEIYASHKQKNEGWQTPVSIMDRKKLSQDTGRYIRKLGNPVLLADKKGKVWMFFVSVSIGGWSTSAINLLMSQDGGHSWGKARRLHTSPFLNLSTLVKGRPFFYQDGSIGLPAYHELAGKFSELIHVSKDGTVLGKSRITYKRQAIQPSIVQLDEKRLLTLMRNTDGVRKIVRSYSKPVGEQGEDENKDTLNWTKADYINLPNPDAAVSIVSDGNILVVAFNNLTSDRNKLALAVSKDEGKSWKQYVQLESAGPLEDGLKSEFSYPYFIIDKAGVYHLVYTWQRTRIAYVSFNRAWLEQSESN